MAYEVTFRKAKGDICVIETTHISFTSSELDHIVNLHFGVGDVFQIDIKAVTEIRLIAFDDSAEETANVGN